MVPATTSLTSFSGETIWPLGQLRLLVTIRDADHCTRAWMNFMILKSMSPYNGIIGRSGSGNRRNAIRKGMNWAMHTPEEKPGYIRMAFVRYDRSTAISSGTPTQYPRRIFTSSTEKKGASPQIVRKPSKMSYTEAEMLRDIEETFCTLRKINMKLNPKKCTFGEVEGMFLGYTITPEGIKPCPDKTEAVLQLSSPRTIKEKCIKKSDFHWTSEAKQAFMQLKQHLSELPLLVAPKPKEELIIYMSASYGAVSAVLMTKRGTVQMPVYFISRALQGPELNYTPMENLVLSLVFAAKRLRRYFQAHPIAVITDQPIKQIISRLDVAGGATKVKRHARRTQYNVPPKDIGERIDTGGLPRKEARRKPARYTSCGNPTGPVDTVYGWIFTASNNEAEYEALIVGLRIVAQMGVRNVQVSVDSKLVANQVLGTYVAKEENMVKYLKKVKSLASGFAKFSISQVPQSKNKKADALTKIASTSFSHLSKQVLVEILKEKYIQEEEVATVIEEEETTS
ncbi:reverse transcriptase domain-containing protein [Tanacetum coccineum]